VTPANDSVEGRALVAAVLSALIPGAGHLYVGERRRGWWLLAIGLGFAVPAAALLVLVLYVSGPGLAVDLSRPFFDQPGWLLALFTVNVLLGVFRLGVAIDAYRAGGGTAPRGWKHGTAFAVTAAMVVALVAGPHYWAGRRNLALYDLLTHDFVTDAAATTVTLPPATTPTVLPATTGSATTVATTSPTTTTTRPPIVVTPTSIPSSPFEGTDRVNVLLMGGDAGPDRTGLRTDSMIVASVDPQSGDVALFGVPRNLKMLPVPEWLRGVWECDCFEGQSNTMYMYGLAHPELFPGGPNPGANASKAIVGELLGLDIHFFALVDLLGFIDVIDAIGGVTITVTRGVYDEFYTQPDGDEVPVSIPPGTYHMDGETALAFARVRRGQSDYERMDRQRCVLEALASQADPVTVLRELPYLVPAVEGSLVTDIPVRDWPDILEFLDRTDTSRMTSVRFIPAAPELAGTGLSYIDGTTDDGFGIPNTELIRSVVRDVLAGEEFGAGIPTLEEVCG
jgi:LCP family protein required for cell wall assembly